MRRLAASALSYAAVLWTAGFAFGVVRETLLRPAVGPVWAQLAEAPAMALAIWLAAGWIVRRGTPAPLAVGSAAVLVLVAVETVFALAVLGQTPAAYLAAYDVTRGTVFPLLLLFTAAAPAIRTRIA